MNSESPLLIIKNLSARYTGSGGDLPALHNISLALPAGQSLGLIGETGSGKTTLARCLMGLLPWQNLQGSIRLRDRELVGLDETAMQTIRWRQIALAFQGAGGGFNPIYSIGQQIADTVAHLDLSRNTGNGFVFIDFVPDALWWACTEAMNFFRLDPEKRCLIVQRVMRESMEAFSIEKTTLQYVRVYERLLGEALV